MPARNGKTLTARRIKDLERQLRNIPFWDIEAEEVACLPWEMMSSVHSDRYKLLLERLKAARVASGMTQVQVAEALGQPQSFVSKCESGERRIDPVELDQFARLYKQPLAYFLPD